MRTRLLFIAVAALAGADTAAAEPGKGTTKVAEALFAQAPVARPDVESITYKEVTVLKGAAASCGTPRCPAFSVIVNADGSARFEGRDTAVAMKRFKVSRATWRALVDRLTRYRPALSIVVEPGSPACVHASQIGVGRDPVAMISWTAGGRTDQILFNGECDRRGSEEAVSAIEASRQILFELLPLGKFVDGYPPAR